MENKEEEDEIFTEQHENEYEEQDDVEEEEREEEDVEQDKEELEVERKASLDFPNPGRSLTSRRASLPCPAQLNAMHLSRLQTAASSSRPAYLSLWPQRGEARPCSRSSPGEGKEDGFRAKTVTFERQIHSIPTIPEVHEPLEKKARFRSRNVMSLSDADSVCLICHDDMRRGGGGGAIRDLHCSHSFHRECIEEWLWTKQTCPTCHKHVAMPEPLYWTSTRVIVP